MWMTSLWFLTVVACSDPGAAEEQCTPHVFSGFASLRACHEAVPVVTALLQAHKPFETPIRIEATCVTFTPDREA